MTEEDQTRNRNNALENRQPEREDHEQKPTGTGTKTRAGRNREPTTWTRGGPGAGATANPVNTGEWARETAESPVPREIEQP